VGLRALAFLGMTLFNLTFALSKIPSSPTSPIVQKHLMSLYYSFDLWLMLSGFYLSLGLCKQYCRDKHPKVVLLAFLRRFLKLVILSAVSIVCINFLIHSAHSGPIWSLTLTSFETECNPPVIGPCNYGLWVWLVELEMCMLCCLLFLVYQKTNYKLLINGAIIVASLLIATLFGKSGRKDDLQGNITRCPLTRGIVYLVGFEMGMAYHWFRAHKNKPKLIPMRLCKYQLFRVGLSLMGLSGIALVYLYLLLLIDWVPPMPNQLLLQLFHLLYPLSFAALLLPEMLGFENVVGALFRDHFMNILSKLSFCSYTIFYLATLLITNTRKEDLYVNTAKVLCLWICSIAISLLSGFLLCLLVEMPVHKLLILGLGDTSLKAFIEFN
jgi:hypothetical protein